MAPHLWQHQALRSLGAVPIHYRAHLTASRATWNPTVSIMCLDAVGGANITSCSGALHAGGTVVGFAWELPECSPKSRRFATVSWV